MPQNIVGFEAERNYREDPSDLPSHPLNETFLVNFISGCTNIFSPPHQPSFPTCCLLPPNKMYCIMGCLYHGLHTILQRLGLHLTSTCAYSQVCLPCVLTPLAHGIHLNIEMLGHRRLLCNPLLV